MNEKLMQLVALFNPLSFMKLNDFEKDLAYETPIEQLKKGFFFYSLKIIEMQEKFGKNLPLEKYSEFSIGLQKSYLMICEKLNNDTEKINELLNK